MRRGPLAERGGAPPPAAGGGGAAGGGPAAPRPPPVELELDCENAYVTLRNVT